MKRKEPEGSEGAEQGAAAANAVLEAYKQLPKTGKPQPHEHTVLAGFTITTDDEQPFVVSIGTGNKCLGASKRSSVGAVVNDCHAEVVARRAFACWLRGELLAFCSTRPDVTQSGRDSGANEQPAEPTASSSAQVPATLDHSGAPAGQPTSPTARPAASTNTAYAGSQLFVRDRATGRVRLREGVRVDMYVSMLPCGDASIVAGAPTAAAGGSGDAGCSADAAAGRRTGAKIVRIAEAPAAPTAQATAAAAGPAATAAGNSETRPPPGRAGEASIAAGMLAAAAGPTCCQPQVVVPQAHEVEAEQAVGVCRRKPGKGDATLSMSCSDKLARWGCLGLQGALLLGVLAEPVYLASLVVALPPGVDVSGIAPYVEAVTRAVAARTEAVSGRLQPPCRRQAPRVHLVASPPADLGLASSEVRRSPSGLSINWVASPGTAAAACTAAAGKARWRPSGGSLEVLLAAHGCKAGAPKKPTARDSAKVRSRLCRAAVLEAQRHLLRACFEGFQQATPAGALPAALSTSYQGAKAACAPGYLASWQALKEAPSIFASWIPKVQAESTFGGVGPAAGAAAAAPEVDA